MMQVYERFSTLTSFLATFNLGTLLEQVEGCLQGVDVVGAALGSHCFQVLAHHLLVGGRRKRQLLGVAAGRGVGHAGERHDADLNTHYNQCCD